jgi:glycosyltransferase involved in cell wall biosynthesis
MASARALVVTAAEEFGIAAVESLACGRPVIALGSGGVLESVRAGETGVYYGTSDPEALAAAVAGFDPASIDPQACVTAAQRFGTQRFQTALQGLVAEAIAAERAPRPDERPTMVTGLLPLRRAS